MKLDQTLQFNKFGPVLPNNSDKKIHDIKLVVYGVKSKKKEVLDKIDLQKLRDLCVSPHGLVNDEIRRIVWPILLNANVLKENVNINVDHSWQKLGKFTHRESP